ncbi:hypothetical protein [Gillisia limnaea]|uniref:Uncharacterized protein n=1 Tax=Gillisia limnaea (strain DSM 15749 / LMG 21470 / R-8282) TaxID=865937 RepID=H2BVC1_GILLR|nr:hypothetical protein [Gillisia limnaea]EHQ01786.1 hypothetical protein Gilli_1112 [Gillisia limnaea DSM 15749]
MFNNRRKYSLSSPLGKIDLKMDPMGWDKTETEIGRSEKTYGIFLTVSNNLEFTGKAKEFLELNWNTFGVQAEVTLIKWEKHPISDEWLLSYTGELDFSTREVKDNKFKIDAIEGGLREVFTSQLKEKYELNRKEDINGEPITPLSPSQITIAGREIYLLSRFVERDSQFTTKSGRWSSINEDRESFHPFPVNPIANSDTLNITPPYESYKAEERWDDKSTINMFFAIADRDRGITKFKGSASFKVSSRDVSRVNEYNFKFVVFSFTSDEDGSNLTRDLTPVFQQNLGGLPAVGSEFTVTLPEITLEPKKNESYAMGLYSVGQYGGPIQPPTFDGWANITFSDFKASFTWAEDSFYQRTNSKFLTAYEVGKRLIEIYTGKPKFISSTLQKDEYPALGFSCGGWIRNLQKVDEEDNIIEWPLTLSFEDYFRSIDAIEPVAYGIVTKGAKQFVRLEKRRFFFQPYITIRLGLGSKYIRTTAGDFIYSSFTTGYTQGGNYEKPLGLDEPNIQTTFISPITKTDNKYEALGTSRADSYAVEDARRMQYENFPDEDTPYDKDNFLLDAKFRTRSNLKDYYDLRLWQDDFEQVPTGIYSPETAFNLRLSPANNRNRHAYWFNCGLMNDPTKKIRYASSEGNSELKTKLPGKPEVKENEDVIIQDLSNPIFSPDWIEFEYPRNQELIDLLQSTTEINGEEINNYYGLVEFINENGNKERGYIFDVKIKNVISFKLLKSYGF